VYIGNGVKVSSTFCRYGKNAVATASYGSLRHSTAVYGNLRQSTAIYDNLRQSTAIYGNLRQSTAVYGTLRHVCGSFIEAFVSVWLLLLYSIMMYNIEDWLAQVHGILWGNADGFKGSLVFGNAMPEQSTKAIVKLESADEWRLINTTGHNDGGYITPPAVIWLRHRWGTDSVKDDHA
jgi:hypothetical protein